MTERWLPAPGYEGYYEVSDMGRVRSVERTTYARGRYRTFPAKVLKPDMSTRYARVTTSCEGVHGRLTIHIAVLEAFVGPRPSPSLEGRHLDGNTARNALSNLAWGTPVENAADRKLHGTQLYGTQYSRAVLDESKVARILELEGVATLQEIADEIGCGLSTVHHVMAGRTWSWCTGRQYANRETENRSGY